MNILVSGGAGFIGSHLVKKLIEEGHAVTALDNFSRGLPKNLEGVRSDKMQLKQVDLYDVPDFEKIFSNQKYDVFFHLAAINGTEYFYKKPDVVLDVNTVIMMNAVKLALKHRVGRFVFFSSSEVYQMAPTIPTPENVPISIPDITNPRFSYAISKVLGEAYCYNYLKKHELPFTIIRPHNFYGPRMGYKHVIPELALKILRLDKNKTLEIQGNGLETRAFCYIDDAVNGIVLAAFSPQTINETIHLGDSREEIAIGDLVKIILEKLGRNDLSFKALPLREGSVNRRCPDVSKAARLMGYKPLGSLSKGLDATLEWVIGDWKNGTIQEK